MAELSLTGQGKEFTEFTKSSLDQSQNSLFMAKGFEAIGSLIDLDFTKCINLLDELEKSTREDEIKVWVDQISNLCRAYVNFHNGNYQLSLKHAEVAIASPMKSGTLDPMDKGRLIRLVACIGFFLVDHVVTQFGVLLVKMAVCRLTVDGNQLTFFDVIFKEITEIALY